MEKRGLGRGLSALIPESQALDREGQVREIPVGQVVANPYQPRILFDPIKMEELVASIREHGILQPVLMRQVGHERYQLIAGERRFRAAQIAGLRVIPALVKESDERESLEMAIVENVQREDIGVMEAARAYKRMTDEFGMSLDTISQRVGKSRSAISNTTRLLDLPEEIQESLECGEITEGHGRAILTAGVREDILRVWQAVVKKRLSVRETEKLARELKTATLSQTDVAISSQAVIGNGASGVANSEPNSRFPRLDPNESAVAEALQQALGTKVTLRHTSGGAGRIEIEFYSAQERDRLVELLTERN